MMVNHGCGKAFLATCGKTFDEIEINFSSFCSIVSISLRIISLIGFFQISEVLLRNISPGLDSFFVGRGTNL